MDLYITMNPDELERVYTKTLSNTDVNERLAFPVRLVGYIWGPHDPRDKGFRVVDRFGLGWDLRARMRWDPQGHRKPEVYGPEWKRFVRMNCLRVGDELVFYRHPDPAPPSQAVFVVSVKRELTLMGQTFSAHIVP